MGRDDLAIEHLLRSLSFVSDCGTYVQLAEAYGRSARKSRLHAQRSEYRRLIEDCGRTIKAICGQSHPDHISELVAQIDTIVAQFPTPRVPESSRTS